MNIIPKINGEFKIISNNKISIRNLNIIDQHNLLTQETIKLINSNFFGQKPINTKFILNNDNSYKIKIINGQIFIETSKELAYNALITLLNLQTDLYKDMFIEDYPKYKHREFSIDVARHYFSVDEIKKLIDEASRLKLNKIHLHLSDNQGWRIESKKYPILNDIGGKDGFYTTKELKDIVQYAKNRYIEIIPEIDIPGHVGAILASFPELSCSGQNISLDKGYKTNDKILCFGNPRTINVIKNLLDELMDIFPSKYIHIGCDELDLTHNKMCAKCKELMIKNGFRNLYEVVTDFINQIALNIMNNNREVIVWNDATRYGKLNEKIIVQNWFDYPLDKTNIKEFENNRRFIFGSTIHTYFDYPLALIPLKNTYNFSPKINNKDLTGQNILGISSHIWTEVIDNNKELEEKIFPRLIAFAESAWTNKLDYNDFLNRLEIYLNYLNERNIYYISSISNDEVNEIANFFKTFLNSNGNNFSFYQTLIGTKLILKLIKESNHLQDIPDIAIKTLSKIKK